MSNPTANSAVLSPVAPLSIASVLETLKENMAKRPRQCLFRVLTVSEEDLTPGTTATKELNPENLRGQSLLLWQELARTPELYEPILTISLEPTCCRDRVKAHIEVHRKHDEKIICGRYLAHKEMQKSARKIVAALRNNPALTLKLVIVHAGDKPDDASYRKELKTQAAKIGIVVDELQIAEHPTPVALRAILQALNSDSSVSGVMVQTIRDKGIDAVVRETLGDNKDPECVNEHHSYDVLLAAPRTYIGAPSTALSCQALIHDACPNLEGKHVVVINNSPVIGKPLAMLLTRHGATVTLCCKESGKTLMNAMTSQADIIVCATGVRGLVKKEFVKEGAILIDVGINQIKTPEGRELIVGDFVIEDLLQKVSRYTEVPGGVGPLTTAFFLSNLVTQALSV